VPSLISHLSKAQQKALLSDLNYLNTAEIKAFCKRHAVPFAIAVETRDGATRSTGEADRKGVILQRIRQYLTTGTIRPPTWFRANVVCFDPAPAKLKETDRLFYGQYDKASAAMISLLKRLTGGQFENGAIARILARDFWSKGIAPTYREFAAAWLEARRKHTRPNPEWAFLSDRSRGKGLTGWKKLRTAKAKQVLKVLKDIAPPPHPSLRPPRPT
jgi:hypothetical protein